MIVDVFIHLLIVGFSWIGNIRVYCRIRPFLPGQNRKQTSIDFIGENGELVVVNPSKQGKDSHRLFKFNKVFGPTATQGFISILLNFVSSFLSTPNLYHGTCNLCVHGLCLMIEAVEWSHKTNYKRDKYMINSICKCDELEKTLLFHLTVRNRTVLETLSYALEGLLNVYFVLVRGAIWVGWVRLFYSVKC